ncbi:hypothetical protein V8C44DRAFT_330489 [Trichoderma aethiopicum]
MTWFDQLSSTPSSQTKHHHNVLPDILVQLWPAKPFRGCLRSPSKRHFLQTAAAGLVHAGLVTSIGEGPAQRRAIACATIHAHWVRSGKKGSPGLGKHMSLASFSPVRNSSRRTRYCPSTSSPLSSCLALTSYKGNHQLLSPADTSSAISGSQPRDGESDETRKRRRTKRGCLVAIQPPPTRLFPPALAVQLLLRPFIICHNLRTYISSYGSC